MSNLAVGTLIGSRFEIERVAGSGGMGTVFRAVDHHTRQRVALKLLNARDTHARGAERFAREAQVIADLRHAGIVSYIAHGETSDGEPYLAMEWLDGEDLSQRLERGPLDLSESLILLRRAADALSAAHRRGVVHRDIKPSNIFLREGKTDRVTILDFGIARWMRRVPTLTRTGVALGTPGYMAPEQARGDREITPSADIFALGCVLYECLTGQRPFTADHLMALFARILFDAAPKVRDLRPEIPDPIGALVDRMLDKDPARRPPDAGALCLDPALFIEIPPELAATIPAASPPSPRALEDREQHLFSVVIAVPGAAASNDPDAPTSIAPESLSARRAAMEGALSAYRGQVEWLADRSLIVALTVSESAHDLAARAARCAFTIRDHWPDARIALATGRAVLEGDFPVGDAVDRAAALVRERASTDETIRTLPAEGDSGIWLDALSGDLLEGRFALSAGPEGTRILSERISVDETRLLLGKPTPCVGRDRDLDFLASTLEQSIEESTAQAVLVTAPPGFGKSRLRHELLRRLAVRQTDVEILVGRGDPVGRGTPYGLLAQALRQLCGVRSGDAEGAQAITLREALSRRIDGPDAPRIIEFLSEMCGVSSAEEPSPKLRAARNDPKLMGDQVSRAFTDWLRAECAERAVLIVLEDLHWGDALTVNLVDVALRDLRDQPLMVLALARPEVKGLFPRLWTTRDLKEIALSGLSRRASERLVRQVLGDAVSDADLARVVDHAAGNALYLEELVRALAEGKRDELPATVLAMLQARLSCLSPPARRVLRSASVFGETFWQGGVRALFGRDASADEIARLLHALVDGEVIERHRASRYPDEEEYRFRHALMRDAAYSMLTGPDAMLGHRIASVYLEGAGERDPMILAEHARQGGDLGRAAPLYLRAAEQAFACSDWEAISLRVERGIACGASGDLLGGLRALEAASHYYRSDVSGSHGPATAAIALLPPGDRSWCRTMGFLFVVAPSLGHYAQFSDLIAAFLATEPAEDARVTYVEAAARLVIMFSVIGQRASATAMLERAREVAAALGEDDISGRAFMTWAESTYAVYMTPDPWRACELGKRSVDAFTAAGDIPNLAMAHLFLGLGQASLGEVAAGVDTMERGLSLALSRHELMSNTALKANLAAVLVPADGRATPDRIDRAREVAADALRHPGTTSAILNQARGALGRAQIAAGDLAEGEVNVRAAVEELAMMPTIKSGHLATLLYCLIKQGRAAEAAEVAKEAIALEDALGGTGYTEVQVRLAAAEALSAAGDAAAAEAALRETVRQIEIRAEKIPDAAQRDRFLAEVPENARAIALARATERA